ncbi:rhodanese-like domain-containing protein [Salipaludibacillus daqingensis]|uniref:rhodanese-like domain-containing protein n=1 Tax=Salipaludibacillus daqingensis TaxID=3041001 RepID=UPI002475003F|nr:rhodanese-like domain-containing protein [Salipaludibacillus daqingensis]
MKSLLFLLSITMMVLAVAGCSDTNEATGDMNEMTAAELQEEVEGSGMDETVNYIDVREEDEFASSHIEGFENIPMGELMDDASQLPKDEEIVILCNTQNRSIQVGESMIEQGYDANNITIVMGGISDYEGEKVE